LAVAVAVALAFGSCGGDGGVGGCGGGNGGGGDGGGGGGSGALALAVIPPLHNDIGGSPYDSALALSVAPCLRRDDEASRYCRPSLAHERMTIAPWRHWVHPASAMVMATAHARIAAMAPGHRQSPLALTTMTTTVLVPLMTVPWHWWSYLACAAATAAAGCKRVATIAPQHQQSSP
jgi:hypothetical protein